MATEDDQWLHDLQNMERVVEIFELLGGQKEPAIVGLVTPYRKFIRTDDVLLREAPFAVSLRIPHRLYLFKDALILGRVKETQRGTIVGGGLTSQQAKDAAAAMGPRKKSFRLSFARGKAPSVSKPYSESIDSVSGGWSLNGSGAGTISRYKVKLSLYKELSGLSIKPCTDADNLFGFSITMVQRMRVDAKWVTKVDKIELWFNTKEARDSLQDEMDELKTELEAETKDGSNTTERSWAKGRRAKSGTLTGGSTRTSSTRSMADSTDTTYSETSNLYGGGAPLSLEDLAKRYNVEFGERPTLENTAKFEISFGDGPMGFSLSSAPSIGVIVGRLAVGSFAHLGGCAIGDRLEHVNGVDIDFDMSWQRAVEVVKAAGRPVTLGFVRNIALAQQMGARGNKQSSSPRTNPANQFPQQLQHHSSGEDSVVVAVGVGGGGAVGGEDGATGAAGAAPSSGKRNWSKGRNGMGAAGKRGLETIYRSRTDTEQENSNEVSGDIPAPSAVATPVVIPEPLPTTTLLPVIDSAINDAERIQREINSSRLILKNFSLMAELEQERFCFGVLMEIFDSERSYVKDLGALVIEYLEPLCTMQKPKRCRDSDNASMLCEHGSLRSSCNKFSDKETCPLMSPDDTRTIFMNSEALSRINLALLTAITEDLAQLGEITEVSEALTRSVEVFSNNFIKITPFFSMYALYCHQYKAACDRLQLLRSQDDDVDQFLRETEAKSSQSSLRSLLIKPVQRVCRYPLLFQELLKRMKDVQGVYPDRKKSETFLLVSMLESTSKTVEKIANDVNAKVVVQETIGSMMTVFHELGGGIENGDGNVNANLLAPSRRFIRSEDVFLKEMSVEGEPLPFRLYLFNDMVILGREKTEQGGTGSRAKSLNRKSFVRDRAKSVQRAMGIGEGGGGGANDAPPPWSYEAAHWIDLHGSGVRPLSKPDNSGWYGFRIKSVKRTNADVVAGGGNGASGGAGKEDEVRVKSKRITWSTNVLGAGAGKDGAAAGGGNGDAPKGKVITSVQIFEIRMPLRDRMQTLLNDIEEGIGILQFLQTQAQKGLSKFGAQNQKKTRSWIQKKASREEVPGGGVKGGAEGSVANRVRSTASGSTVDAKEALHQLSKKYSSRGNLGVKDGNYGDDDEA